MSRIGANRVHKDGCRPFWGSPTVLLFFAAIHLAAICTPAGAQQEVAPDAQAAYEQALGTSDQATRIRYLRSALSLSPQFVLARLELAKVLIDLEQYRHAVIQVDSILNYDRRNADVWFQKGRAHASIDEHDIALKCFQRAIATKNDVPEFFIHLGRIHFAREEYEKALAAFESGLSLAIAGQDKDSQAEAWEWKGRTHSATTDTANALVSFRRAIDLKPERSDVAQRLARIEEQIELESSYRGANAAMQRKDWQQAKTLLEEILSKEPQFKDAADKLTIAENQIQAKSRVVVIDPPKEKESGKPSTRPNLPEPLPEEPSSGASSKADSLTRIAKEDTASKVVDPSKSAQTAPGFEGESVSGARQDGLSAWVYVGGGGFVLLIGLTVAFYRKRARSKSHAVQGSPTVPISKYQPTVTILPKRTLEKEFGRYRIEEVLGVGGMGQVYKAFDLKLERHLALKVIRFDEAMDKEEMGERVKRFHTEAKATAKLNHPNIVSLFDYDEKDRIFYMTMEYVEGLSVQQMLGQKKKFEIAEALDVVSQSCSALDYAHERDVIHRDIKPSNIMVSNEGVVKILDFGLAKMLAGAQSQLLSAPGQIKGTPSYMSPEQIEAKDLDGRTDIYSLGIIFFEMLSGERPFSKHERDTYAQLFNAILRKEPPKLTSLRTGISSWLEAIVDKMLSKDPGARYQRPSEIITALRPFG